METDLVPMSVGDVFDEAFDLYKRNFALFAGIVAAIHVPAQVVWDLVYYGFHLDRIARATGDEASQAYALLGMAAISIVMVLVYTFLAVVQNGALAIAISERHLGRPVTIQDAYRATLRHVARLVFTWLFVFMGLAMALGVILVVGLFMFAILAVVMAGFGATGDVGPAITLILWLLACIGAELAVGVGLGAFVTQAVVVEGHGYFQALGRNWQLLRGRYWRVLGATCLLFLILLALLGALTASATFLLGEFVYPLLGVPVMVQSIVGSVLLGLVWMFLQPYLMTSLTLFYYDQRVRKEGLDLALLEQQMQAQHRAGAAA